MQMAQTNTSVTAGVWWTHWSRQLGEELDALNDGKILAVDVEGIFCNTAALLSAEWRSPKCMPFGDAHGQRNALCLYIGME